MSPQRIQRRRTKGWQMPEGAVYVGRPTMWGNPWGVHRDSLWSPPERPWRVACGDYHHEPSYHATKAEAAQAAVGAYTIWLTLDTLYPNEWINSLIVQHTNLKAALDRRELAGRDLVCWCPLDQPCHADVLLCIANGGAA
jgi:hypothetical protein